MFQKIKNLNTSLTKHDLVLIALLAVLFAAVGTFVGLHSYRIYMNQFVGHCVETAAECMVPIIG